MNVYVLCVEGQGDGSSNWSSYNRPGISVFTSSSKLVTTLKKYMKDDWKSKIGRNMTREDARKIFEDGGIRITERRWVRIIKYGSKYKQDKNPEDLQEDYWYKWDEDELDELEELKEEKTVVDRDDVPKTIRQDFQLHRDSEKKKPPKLV